MEDKILMQNMAFFGNHGVLEEEKKLGQKFFVDIQLLLDTSPAGQSDDMNLSVSYADVYDVIKEIMENRTYDLIEAVAENIAKDVLLKFELLDGITVRIKKPEAPVAGIFDYMGVEITRYA
jgi:dihydroneopterin aldolase